MIDSHIHVAPPRLPGTGTLAPLLGQDPDTVAAAVRAEMASAGITAALAMGGWTGDPEAGDARDPLGVGPTLAVARAVPGLHAVGVADPTRADRDHLRACEDQIKTGRVKALKAYLGYLPYAPDSPGYRPYYELAERHRLPVVFHTGDTYSARGRLRYAQPLLVDDVAVDHPRVNFVIAHVGNPWMADAAEVVYKNINVWADVSGLLVGDAAYFAEPARQEAVREAQANLARAFRYAERPNRFLYGSDWPLAPMASYRPFVEAAVPADYHACVFEENARTLFRV